MPVMLHDGSIRLFQRPKTELPEHMITPGGLLGGKGLPSVLGNHPLPTTVIREVYHDLDEGHTYVNLQGTQESTYTAKEMLATFGVGWNIGPQLKGPDTKQAPAAEDDDDPPDFSPN